MAEKTKLAISMLPLPANFQAKRRKKEDQQQRRRNMMKSRVYIGDALDRWRNLKNNIDIKTDAELAFLLLNSFEKDNSTSTPLRRPPSSLSSATRSSPEKDDDGDFAEVEVEVPADVADHQESSASTDLDAAEEFNSLHNATNDWEDDSWFPEFEGRPLSSSEEDFAREVDSEEEGDSDETVVPRICVNSGAALRSKMKIENVREVGEDETVLDVGEDGPESKADPDPSSDVHVEDDIIDHPAVMAYTMCLQQLVDYLQLPNQVCSVFNPTTRATCGAPKPFNVRITPRGTAAKIEWICAHGHTVWKWTSQPCLNFGMLAGDFLWSCNVVLSGNTYSNLALFFKYMNMGMVNKTTYHKIQSLYCIETIKENASSGKYQYRELFNKMSRKWTLQIQKQKDDSYIPGLQRAILLKRLSCGKGMPAVRPKRPEDPRRLGVLSGIPAPPKEDLLRTQATRGIGKSLPEQHPSS